MTCTFFGHRNATEKIKPELRAVIIDLIKNHNVKTFYVGNHGNFDNIVFHTLKELSEEYPISYSVVLSYISGKRTENDIYDYRETVFPEGIEKVPKRFAITYSNMWMIKHSDYVVTYVNKHINSGAAKFKELAEKQEKTVINLCKKRRDNSLLNL